jgi:hypothetical protein
MADENSPDWKCRVCHMSDDLFALDEPEMCRRCYDRACSEGATKGEERPWNAEAKQEPEPEFLDECVLCGGDAFQQDEVKALACIAPTIKALASLALAHECLRADICDNICGKCLEKELAVELAVALEKRLEDYIEADGTKYRRPARPPRHTGCHGGRGDRSPTSVKIIVNANR